MAVVDVVPRWHREDDLVARINEHAEGGIDPRARAGRNYDPVVAEVQAESLGVKAGDGGTKLRHPGRGRVVRLSTLKCLTNVLDQRRRNGKLGGAEIADRQVHDRLAPGDHSSYLTRDSEYRRSL